MQREHNGRPVDHTITRRKLLLSQTFATYFPGIASKVGAFALEKRMKKAFPDIDPSWNLLPAPALLNGGVLISDELIPLLKKGSIVSVPGIKRFAPNGPSSIEFSDGTVLESIDAVVFATGYYFDYGFLSPEADPTTFPAREFNNAPHANGLVYPRLYQGLLSTKYPSSLAFMGPFRGHSFTAFSNADLSSQAISQLWLGNYPMPSSAEMEAWCDANYASSLWQIKNWHIQKIGTSPLFLERWCNQVAGNGVDFMLSWTSWEAWKFWWEERELYKLLMDGINTPYLFRLFESPRGNKGRKRWPGAREAIYKANGKVYSGKTE